MNNSIEQVSGRVTAPDPFRTAMSFHNLQLPTASYSLLQDRLAPETSAPEDIFCLLCLAVQQIEPNMYCKSPTCSQPASIASHATRTTKWSPSPRGRGIKREGELAIP